MIFPPLVIGPRASCCNHEKGLLAPKNLIYFNFGGYVTLLSSANNQNKYLFLTKKNFHYVDFLLPLLLKRIDLQSFYKNHTQIF